MNQNESLVISDSSSVYIVCHGDIDLDNPEQNSIDVKVGHNKARGAERGHNWDPGDGSEDSKIEKPGDDSGDSKIDQASVQLDATVVDSPRRPLQIGGSYLDSNLRLAKEGEAGVGKKNCKDTRRLTENMSEKEEEPSETEYIPGIGVKTKV